MNWEYLKIFADVCKDLNISRSAKRLNKSHSAVSQTIALLEDQLQAELFKRSANKIEKLTDSGNKLLIVARSMSDKFLEWQISSNFDSNTHYDCLEIEIGHTLGNMWLPHYINLFYEENLSLNLKVKCVSDESSFLKNYGDLCISTYLENRPDIHQEYLMTFHLGLYASEKYLEKYGYPADVSELVKHRLMSYGNGKFHQYGEKINEIFRDNKNFNSGCFLEIDSGQSLVTLASNGHGIIALSKEYPALKDTKLIRILPEIENKIDIYVSVPNHKKNKKAAYIFSNFIHDAVKHQKEDTQAKKKYEKGTVINSWTTDALRKSKDGVQLEIRRN